ncbi:hypothetical protein [Sphingomonas sp. OK281]|uniref:hypothetical protein n=1 Tax=Sphingomonas sp. OK281 TaxID=1881067 RepID=UPI0020C87EDE|nr:hypothetical protein [Sphingomonas sp. OK281]
MLDHLAVDATVQRDREVGRTAAIGNLVDQPIVGEQIAKKADLGLDIVKRARRLGCRELLLESAAHARMPRSWSFQSLKPSAGHMIRVE